jgi:hypothetical protein
MKTIRSAADLAINAAAPASDAPLHARRPNICNRDAFLALAGHSLDNQWLANKQADDADFERRIADIDPGAHQ